MYGGLQLESQQNNLLLSQVHKLQHLVESLQKQLALKDLLVEELTQGDAANETMMDAGGAFSHMLHMPDSIE